MSPNIIGNSFPLLSSSVANNETNKGNKTTATTILPAISKNIVPSRGNSTLTASKSLKAKSKVAGETLKMTFSTKIVWPMVLAFVILHTTGLYGLWLVFAENAYLEAVFAHNIAVLAGFGVTAGAHRLWAHRSYKARLPLRIFLMLGQSLSLQKSIYTWVRDHRAHHKFTETDADPHNSRRGFFFAHMGWLMCKKHPDVKGKGKQVDMTDLEADPVVMFQWKYYEIIMPICAFVIPTLIPYYVMGSTIQAAFFVCCMLRLAVELNITFAVNSVAHFYGMKPYDRNSNSVNNKIVARLSLGEGWHNYHHVFPWDYKAAELGSLQNSLTTAFINFMARIGQAYDLKTVSEEMVLKRVRRTGDGSHPSMANENNNMKLGITDELVGQLDHNNEDTLVWGWNDKDVSAEDRRGVIISEKKEYSYW